MKCAASTLLCAAFVTLGCGGAPEPDTKQRAPDLGAATADAASDTRVLSEAQGAANEVIRAATDCEAALERLPEAREALEAAKSELRTSTGQTTLVALERQLDRIAEACGATG